MILDAEPGSFYPLTSFARRYVQLSITDNYIGFQNITVGGDRVGLGEVRFATQVIPEPATLGLMALLGGSLVLLHRRRML